MKVWRVVRKQESWIWYRWFYFVLVNTMNEHSMMCSLVHCILLILKITIMTGMALLQEQAPCQMAVFNSLSIKFRPIHYYNLRLFLDFSLIKDNFVQRMPNIPIYMYMWLCCNALIMGYTQKLVNELQIYIKISKFDAILVLIIPAQQHREHAPAG